jgi:hypothetical protein
MFPTATGEPGVMKYLLYLCNQELRHLPVEVL